MVKKIYLQGGGDTKEMENFEIDSRAFKEIENKKVYVLDLTTENKEKLESYGNVLREYFKKLGAEEINFISMSNSLEEAKKNIKESGLLYLPGGDTELLIKKVKEKELTEIVKSFEGVIIGISAGAYLMCIEYVKIRAKTTEFIRSLNVVDIRMKAHYEKKSDQQLLELSKEKDIYAVPDKSVIVANENNELSFIGEVYLFSKGEKTKVN